jgi:hypothetical protein
MGWTQVDGEFFNPGTDIAVTANGHLRRVRPVRGSGATFMLTADMFGVHFRAGRTSSQSVTIPMYPEPPGPAQGERPRGAR